MIVYFCQLNKYPKRDFRRLNGKVFVGTLDTEEMAQKFSLKKIAETLESQDWSLPSAYFDNESFMYFHRDLNVLTTFINGWSSADSWYRQYRFNQERFYAIN